MRNFKFLPSIVFKIFFALLGAFFLIAATLFSFKDLANYSPNNWGRYFLLGAGPASRHSSLPASGTPSRQNNLQNNEHNNPQNNGLENPNNFYISSFNVLRLGHNNGKNYTLIANTIKDMHIIGLIEVMNKKGVEELVDALELVSNKKWRYHISPTPAGSSDYKEFFAFIWQDDSVSLINPNGFYPDINSRFARPPYGATFKIKNFDFTFILAHSIFGSKKSLREAEAFYIKDVYQYFQDQDPLEKDIIIGGDFNLPANSSAFKSLIRYLNYKIIYCIDPYLKTTIGKNKMANSYDNIFLSLIYTTEFTGVSGVIDSSNGNLPYFKKYMSDHLPVFIQVDASFDDD